MVELTTYSFSLPVHIADERDGQLVQGKSCVLGTCFPIGGNFMLTAGHVVKELQEAKASGRGHPAIGIFHPTSFVQVGVRASEMEIFEPDIGIVKVEFLHPEQEAWLFPLHWSVGRMNLGSPVRTPGYAFADHNIEGNRYIVQRSFQGSIVSEIGVYLPAGAKGEPFGVYETSFAAPRGHSGAPLLQENGRVVGVVIGNSKSKILVLDTEETSTDGKTTKLIEQWDSLSLGISVQSCVVLNLQSKLLGNSIRGFLEAKNLVHTDG